MIRSATLATAACALSVFACSRANAAEQNGWINYPPKAYQGDATVTVEFRDPQAIPALCTALGTRVAAGAYTVACQVGLTLILPNPCRWPNHSDYQRIACHEMAHFSGWPADHSNPSGASQ